MTTPTYDYPDYHEWHYPPPGYVPPAHRGPLTYPPSGYTYPPRPAYGVVPPQHPRPLAQGVIPLRPLSLVDIFNGATSYIRANPRATLGLTAVIVVITQVITFAGAIGPLAAAGRGTTKPSDELTGADVGAWMLSAGFSGVVGWLAGILLTGMLTVVAGRAVFGAPISAGETWARIRGRLPALAGLVALEGAGLSLLVGAVGLIVGAIAVGDPAAALILGFPLVLMAIAAVVYLYTALSFAPVLIVLERLSVIDAMTRSLHLIRNSFWRVLGVRTLTWLVVALIGGSIVIPFSLLGQLAGGSEIVAATVTAVGAAIGQIVTAPFSAGVIVLLYTDRRIRSEAFDLVVQSGVAPGPAAGGSTDALWLIRLV